MSEWIFISLWERPRNFLPQPELRNDQRILLKHNDMRMGDMVVFSARIQEKRPWLADMKQAVNAIHLQYSAESETRVAKALHVESLITGRAI